VFFFFFYNNIKFKGKQTRFNIYVAKILDWAPRQGL